METSKYLIVNADDFGQSAGINRGIIEAFENGIVTSASLMVRWPAAADAAQYGRNHPGLSVGLHVDLGEWSYQDGNWIRLYGVVDAKNPESLAIELSHQLATFRDLMKRDPTHIDSHQHVHRSGTTRSLLVEIAQQLDVPLRDVSQKVRYYGGFYGQTDEGTSLPDNITTDAIIRIFDKLPAGFTELGCHPASEIDLDTMYRDERLLELNVLCSPRTRASLQQMNIELCSFHKVPGFQQ